jgi:hypothetical protein
MTKLDNDRWARRGHSRNKLPEHQPRLRPGDIIPIGAGALGPLPGLALGAAAAAAAATPYYVYPACYVTRQPVVDYWGNLIRYRRVRVCN